MYTGLPAHPRDHSPSGRADRPKAVRESCPVLERSLQNAQQLDVELPRPWVPWKTVLPIPFMPGRTSSADIKVVLWAETTRENASKNRKAKLRSEGLLFSW